MHRKVVPFLFILFMLHTTAAFAVELAPEGSPARKLQRGFLNIAFSPFEFSNEMEKVKLKEADLFLLPTWLRGILKGSIASVVRAGTGVYEILSFPVPAPAGYAPVIEPEFGWEYHEIEEPKV